MRKPLLLLLLTFQITCLWAQRPLTNSRKSSVYTYIYALDDASTLLFLTGNEQKIKDEVLTTSVAKFLTDHLTNVNLAPGNYLQVGVDGNKLHYKLIQKHTAYLSMMQVSRDNDFILSDINGNEITNAQASVRNRLIPYNIHTETYHIGSSKKDTIVKVVYQGVSNFYILSQPKPIKYNSYNNYNNNEASTSWLARLWNKIVSPFNNLFKKQQRFRSRVKTNPGFMVFNKPRYKPNDTVKFKAFILQAKSKLPINDKQLIIRLKQSDFDDGKIIGYVNAYRKGGFEYQFKLNDSLDLRLDNEYYISLESLDSKKYELTKYKGDDERDYLAKRTVYQQWSFRYEDYDLKSTKFNVRVDRPEHSPGLPTSLYFKATDDNGLNVPDGRVSVALIYPQASDYHADHIFIPDTLWTTQLSLDPIGETKLTLPDSIFPKAKITYTVRCTFLNSNNESRERIEYLTYDYHNNKLETKVENDTLKINYLLAGKSSSIKGQLTQINANNDTISTQTINLPSVMPIVPGVAKFIVKADTLTQTEELRPNQAEVQIRGYRTADSLFVGINNPRHLKFWYTIFAGKKIFEQGTGTDLIYKKPFKQPDNVFVNVGYIWGNKPAGTGQNIPYQERNLNININEPATVYPGQQTELEVAVTDSKGKAVANADVTAYSITSKFENYILPPISYLGKVYPYLPYKPLSQFKGLSDNGYLKLNWKYRSKSFGLDTIKYYQFTHPDTTFQIAESTPDSVTQVAPFVVKDGEILPIHILYIDERPMYFSQSQDVDQYSFKVEPGKHSLRFRMVDRVVAVDNIDIPKGMKLIFSVNADSLQNKKARYHKMPDTLIRYEAELINKYMISIVPNFYYHIATLEETNKLFLINYNPGNFYDSYYYRHRGNILVGPFNATNIDFNIKSGLSTTFVGEPDYSYELRSDLLKQKSLSVKYPFNTKLTGLAGITDYSQYVLSHEAIDTIWQNYLDQRNHEVFSRDIKYRAGNARLIVKVDKLAGGSYPYVKSIIVYKYDTPDFMEIFDGRTVQIDGLEAGKYRLLYLFKGNSYYLQENVAVKANGINFYSTGLIKPHNPDSVSLKIAKIIDEQEVSHPDEDATRTIKEIFNEKYLDASIFNSEMRGQIFDSATKEPLTGANIFIAGTKISVQADINGSFKLKVPKIGKLRFVSVGYVTEEVAIQPGQSIKVYLTAEIRYIHETVIRGYVKRSRDETTGASYIITNNDPIAAPEMLLQGKVAGLNIQNVTAAPNSTPLYIVDGVIVSSEFFFSLKADMIASTSTLTANAAIAIYGNQGANGVILVTTKKGADGQSAQSQNIRKNFSDYAFWQPRLTTDADGKVKFKVTYPDDITNWRTFVIGVTDKRQIGFSEGAVKSFKPLSANFVSPLFAVEGDTFSPLGKVLNYTTDTVKLKRTFIYNGKSIDQDIVVKNAHIDTFKITADGKDSLSFEYSIKRGTGYFDGERRTIPVFKQGSLETNGSFDVLERDTTISLKFSPGLKDATLRAEASALPTLLDETEHLRTYEYLCNEQLASKLKALLAEKRIREYLNQPFKWNKDIYDIIKKLMEARNRDGSWGWWKDTPEELWINSHVIEALLSAQSNGYNVALNRQQFIDYLIYRLTFYNGTERLTDIALLKTLGAKADLPSLVRDYEKSLSPKSPLAAVDKYRLMYTRQLAGMPIVIDSLLKDMQHTMFGNVYWGKQGYSLFNNAIEQSLMAYHILKIEGHHPVLLTKLRNYFMEQRSTGYWQNTYQSAQILETILPDMLVDGKKPTPASLVISGDKTETVTKFPYTTTLGANAKITIAKTGDMPVYITAYQKFWNSEPQKVSDDFKVDTWFQKGRDTITKVKGGEPITLNASVNVKADADFVMVEIPIPAGCSYDGKEQSYYGNEVHREYFKNKVSIFCRKLTAGKYKFSVKLMPRYSGNYHLNPAKAEMMYFPVFYGRERMKTFDIN
jgi:hypothetical protein